MQGITALYDEMRAWVHANILKPPSTPTTEEELCDKFWTFLERASSGALEGIITGALPVEKLDIFKQFKKECVLGDVSARILSLLFVLSEVLTIDDDIEAVLAALAATNYAGLLEYENKYHVYFIQHASRMVKEYKGV